MYTESTALFLRSSQQRPHTPRNGEAYRSTAAPASSAEPTHAVQVPPLRPLALLLVWFPLAPTPPARLASATPTVLAAAQRSTTRTAHRGRSRLIFLRSPGQVC